MEESWVHDDHQEQADLARLHQELALRERNALRIGLRDLRLRYRGRRGTDFMQPIRREHGHRPDFGHCVSLFPQALSGRWCWAAVTGVGGEVVRLTGALLHQIDSQPVWLEGSAGCVYTIASAMEIADDEPATHLRLTHITAHAHNRRRVRGIVSLHAAAPESEPLRLYSPHRLPGWPL